MSEHRYIVARNDWIALQIMKKIYKGRLVDYDNVLLRSQRDATRRLQNMPMMKQEEHSVFRVSFDKDKIVRS